MPTSIGLDIGHSGLKIAVVDGSTRKFRVTRFIDHAFEEGGFNLLSDEEVVAEIRKAFKQHKLPAGPVVVAMPAQEVVIRELDVPFTRDDQIAKTIKFQAESCFPSMDIDDVLVEWFKFGEQDERSKLLVFGLPKSHLEARLRFLARCGIDPHAVDLDVGALYNAFTLTRHFQAGQNMLIVDIGAGSLKIVLVEHGTLRLIRSVRTRMGSLPSAVFKASPEYIESESELESSRAASSRLPLVILDESTSFNLDESTTGLEVLEPEEWELKEEFIDKVLLEIDRTMASVQISEPIEQILVTGGGSRFPDIEALFSEHFMIDTTRLQLSESVTAGHLHPTDREAFDLVGATALGLALKGVDYDSTGIDFRKEEFTHKGRWEKVKQGLAATCCLLFILFFLLAFRFKLYEMAEYQKAGYQVATDQQSLYNVVLANTGARDDRAPVEVLPDDMSATLRAEYARLKQELGVFAGVPQFPSALDQLVDFAQRMAATKAGEEGAEKKMEFLLKEVSIQQNQGRVTLLTNEFRAPTIIAEAFQGSQLLKLKGDPSSKSQTERQMEDHGYKYEVQLQWETKEEKVVAGSAGGPS